MPIALPLEKPIAKRSATPVSSALKRACQERIRECVERYQAAGVALPMPTVSFDLRGQTAGKAFYRERHVQLNPVLLAENTTTFVSQTVGHEVAHLAAVARYGQRGAGHGAPWKAMMQLIGLDADRCHQYDTRNSAVVKRPHRYVCACQDHWLTDRMHRQAARNRYRCKQCNTWLRLAAASGTPGRGSSVVAATAPAGRAPVAPGALPPRQPVLTPAPRPPTEAMARYAHALAQRKRLVLTPAILQSFDATAAFIDQAKRLPEAQAVVAVEAPTPRQLDYATSLARKHGQVLSPELLASRAALSAWMSARLAS